MRGIVAALVLALVIPVGAAAQSPEPVEIDESEALYRADAQTQVLSTEAWCAYFTEDGWFMPIDACVAQVIYLLGDPEARYVPEAMVPADAAPAGTGITRKGKNSLETKTFRLAADTYSVRLTHKQCDGAPNALLVPVSVQGEAETLTLTNGSTIEDVAAGVYAIEVLGWPKGSGKKACNWQIKLTPVRG